MATTMTQSLPKPVSLIAWLAVVALGTLALAMIAWSRGESIDALWFIVAAVCIYALGYRFQFVTDSLASLACASGSGA